MAESPTLAWLGKSTSTNGSPVRSAAPPPPVPAAAPAGRTPRMGSWHDEWMQVAAATAGEPPETPPHFERTVGETPAVPAEPQPRRHDVGVPSRRVDAGRGGLLDHRKGKDAQGRDAMVPGAVELVVDRPADPTAVGDQPSGAPARQHVSLRAERAVEKLDDAPLALDRVLQDRPESAGPLGVEAEVGDAGGGEIHGDELGEKTPVDDGVVLQHQQLVGIGFEKRDPGRVVAR